MAELNADFTKRLRRLRRAPTRASSSTRRTLEITKRIPTGDSPTHLSLSRDGKLLAHRRTSTTTRCRSSIPRPTPRSSGCAGFYHAALHALRPGRQVRLRREHRRVPRHAGRSHDARDRRPHPARRLRRPAQRDDRRRTRCGFADAQIDPDGMLLRRPRHRRAACWSTTPTPARSSPELEVGPKPWIVYAEHPFYDDPAPPRAELRRHDGLGRSARKTRAVVDESRRRRSRLVRRQLLAARAGQGVRDEPLAQGHRGRRHRRRAR